MMGFWRCSTTTATLLCYRWLASMSSRIRFVVGCPSSIQRL
uniref:Uncharacterized protein n=1 Tax=Setaria viridis TaxID=4556 RepID=A0A4V6D9R2_SETVI|nr:hypothetical protein SEVIR_3G217650v2 [Setaria viridis]